MPVSKKAMDFLEMLQAASLEQYGYVPEDWVNDVDENAEKIEENIHVNVEANLMYYLQTLQQLSPDLDISKFHTLKMPDSVVSGSKEFLAKIRNDPASFFQDKANQLLIDIYLRDIKDVLAQFDIDIDKFLVGSILNGTVNARIFPVPTTGEYVIAYNGGLLHFINMLFIAITSFGMRENASDKDDMTDIFKRVITGYIRVGHPAAYTRDVSENTDVAQTIGAARLTEQVMIFILGHEYGHAIQNHLGNSNLIEIDNGRKKFEEFKFSWTQELEADLRGLQIALKATGTPITVLYPLIEIFFHLLTFLERALSVVMKGDTSLRFKSSTHPPIFMRFAALRISVTSLLPDNERTILIEMSNMWRTLIDKIWDDCKEYFLMLHEAGEKPHPMWQNAMEEF